MLLYTRKISSLKIPAKHKLFRKTAKLPKMNRQIKKKVVSLKVNMTEQEAIRIDIAG